MKNKKKLLLFLGFMSVFLVLTFSILSKNTYAYSCSGGCTDQGEGCYLRTCRSLYSQHGCRPTYNEGCLCTYTSGSCSDGETCDIYGDCTPWCVDFSRHEDDDSGCERNEPGGSTTTISPPSGTCWPVEAVLYANPENVDAGGVGGPYNTTESTLEWSSGNAEACILVDEGGGILGNSLEGTTTISFTEDSVGPHMYQLTCTNSCLGEDGEDTEMVTVNVWPWCQITSPESVPVSIDQSALYWPDVDIYGNGIPRTGMYFDISEEHLDSRTGPSGNVVSICDYDDNPATVCADQNLNDYTDSSSPFWAEITGINPGYASMNVTAYLDYTCEGGVPCSCSKSPPVELISANRPWWQVKNGNVIALSSVDSQIPSDTICDWDASCVPALISYPEDETPGVPMSGSSIAVNNQDYTDCELLGGCSGNKWNVQGAIIYEVSTNFNYEFFRNKVDATLQSAGSNCLAWGHWSDLGDGYRGYQLAASGIGNVGGCNFGDNKYVIFADGDVNVTSDITVNPGKGFFMLVASGDITIAENVQRLDGIYFAQGTFETLSTGNIPTDDVQLNIRGTVVGMSGVTFGRKLDPIENTENPAEKIEFAPDILMKYPSFLGETNYTWSEIAP